MVQKIFIFSALFITYFLWHVILLVKGKEARHLLLSFVITTIPFQMSIPIFNPVYKTMAATGTFTSKIFLMIPLVASFIILFTKSHRDLFRLYKNERWTGWVLLLILISLFNPYNYAVWATVGFAILFMSYVLFFKLTFINLNPYLVVKAIFTSFAFLCTLQFALAILYPLLDIHLVTTIFQVSGDEWATRLDTRPGAIGFFVTPANLGLFSTIAFGFFLSTYLTGFEKKLSLLLLILTTITIFLTYSRTSYITVVFILFFVTYIYKNAKKTLISFNSILFGLVPALLFLGWVVFYSPLSDTFLKTDAAEMYQARLDHWIIGLEIFKASPIVGVGINTHLEYINQTTALLIKINNDFLSTNPIHNTHLVILAETGIIGFLLWIAFIITSIIKAKFNISKNNNLVFSLTQVAMIISFIVFGFTDWAPLSPSIFPLFLLFTYFTSKYSFEL